MVAGWFSLRQIIKRTSVFHPVCLKKYNKKILTEVWKGKNTKENMKEIKEHEISDTLHRGLRVVPKIDGEIYVSISIGEYLFSALCQKRSCCWKYRKWGCHLKNRYQKNVYAKVVENARITFSVSHYRTFFKRVSKVHFGEFLQPISGKKSTSTEENL